MIGSIKGFVTLVKKRTHDVVTTHCFLHREVLVSETIRKGLKQVPDAAVSMANFIKQRPLKSRIFAKLCESMQKYHVTLSTHRSQMALKRESFIEGI
jgi:hypothetical protein